mgnify:CR=1 FL=1
MMKAKSPLTTRGERIFGVINSIFMVLLALICLLPMVHVIAVSFSDSAAASANQVRFWPKGFNTLAYEMIFLNPVFLRAFGVSVLRTVLGTGLNLLMTILAAYPLSKRKGELKYRGFFMGYFVLTMLIGGGMIPTYLLIKDLHLIDSFWVMILPGCVPVFYVIMMMNFFRGISPSITESALIDGASEARILTQIMLPLSLPSISTIVLFCMVGHWNEWFSGMIYMNSMSKWPLQTLLRYMLSSMDQNSLTASQISSMRKISSRSFQAAQIVFATVPIMMVYPFAQKNFISGMTIGAVKE